MATGGHYYEYQAVPTTIRGVRLLDAFVRMSTKSDHAHTVMMFGWNISWAFVDVSGANGSSFCDFPDGTSSPLKLVGPDDEHSVATCSVPFGSTLQKALDAPMGFLPHTTLVRIRHAPMTMPVQAHHYWGEIQVNVFPFSFIKSKNGRRHTREGDGAIARPTMAATHMSKNTASICANNGFRTCIGGIWRRIRACICVCVCVCSRACVFGLISTYTARVEICSCRMD